MSAWMLGRDKLYCALTCQLLGKSVAAVRQHMRGRKFQRAKARFEADEADLVDEPPLDAKVVTTLFFSTAPRFWITRSAHALLPRCSPRLEAACATPDLDSAICFWRPLVSNTMRAESGASRLPRSRKMMEGQRSFCLPELWRLV